MQIRTACILHRRACQTSSPVLHYLFWHQAAYLIPSCVQATWTTRRIFTSLLLERKEFASNTTHIVSPWGHGSKIHTHARMCTRVCRHTHRERELDKRAKQQAQRKKRIKALTALKSQSSTCQQAKYQNKTKSKTKPKQTKNRGKTKAIFF